MSAPSLLDESPADSPESLSSSRGSTPATANPSTPPSVDAAKTESEKKPVKKRKSWGQELPTPTTNLAPRKRAKTAEEKEQRRVERVLRNRAAAQKSREVKKQQLEKIEKERDDLKKENELLIASNKQLQQLLEQTQQSQDRSRQSVKEETSYEYNEAFTVNPNTLLTPAVKTESSLCMTHQPAVLMCDLPCLQGISTTTSLLTQWIYLVLSFILGWTFQLGQMLTLAWTLPQIRAQYFPQILSLRNSLTVIERLQLRSMSKRCNLALAHLRIATGFSLQPAIALNALWCRSLRNIGSENYGQGKELSRVLDTSGSLGRFFSEGQRQRLVNHMIIAWFR